MHGFRDNEVLLQDGYDVIVIASTRYCVHLSTAMCTCEFNTVVCTSIHIHRDVYIICTHMC